MNRRFFLKSSLLASLATALPFVGFSQNIPNNSLLITTDLELVKNNQLQIFIKKNTLSEILKSIKISESELGHSQIWTKIMYPNGNFGQLSTTFFREAFALAQKVCEQKPKTMLDLETSFAFALQEGFQKNRFPNVFSEKIAKQNSFFVKDSFANWAIANYETQNNSKNKAICASKNGAALVIGQNKADIAQIVVKELEKTQKIDKICLDVVKNFGKNDNFALLVFDKNGHFEALASQNGFKIGIISQQTSILDIKSIVF